MEEQRHPPTPLHLPEHSAKTQALPVSRSPTWASLCHLSDYLFVSLQRERNFAAEENDPLPLYSWVLSVNRNSKTVFRPLHCPLDGAGDRKGFRWHSFQEEVSGPEAQAASKRKDL